METTYRVANFNADDLTTYTAADLAEKIRSGEVSSVEATRAHLDRISQIDGDIHAFLHVSADEALAAAKKVDDSIARGE